MLEDKASLKRCRVRTPPHAHSASQVKRSNGNNFKSPLDLALGNSNRITTTDNNNSAALDLHAALNNISQATNNNFTSAALSLALAGITSPPAIPPPSSKFWDTPPPSFSSLNPASLLQPLPVQLSVPSPPTTSASSSSSSGKQSTISSLSAASASASQFEAATSTNQTGHLVSQGQGQHQVSKYSQLLAVLEEMGKDVRPSYAGSKSSAERLKRGIIHARILVREALMEVEKASNSK